MELSKKSSFHKYYYTTAAVMFLATLPNFLQDTLVQYFISRIMGNAGIEAYGLTYPALIIIFGLASFIPVGIQAMTSKSIGACDHKAAADKISVGLSFGLLILIIAGAVTAIFAPQLIEAFGGSEESAKIGELSVAILRSLSFSTMGFVVTQTLLVTVFFNNRIGKAIALSIESILIEIVITGLVSQVLWTPASVGLGYTISTLVAALNIILQLVIHKPLDNEINYRLLRIDLNIKDFIKIMESGLGELLSWVFFAVVSVIKLSTVINLGFEGAIAGFSISEAINAFAEGLYSAIFYALISIIGFAYGSGDKEYYNSTVRNSIKYTLSTSVLVSGVLMALSHPLVTAFAESDDLSVIRIATIDVNLYFAGFPLYTLVMVFTICLLINEKFIHAYVISAIEEIIGPVAVMMTLPRIFGTTGFSVYLIISELIALIYIFFVFRFMLKREPEHG